MVGGESRKSRRPSAATESKASVNFRRTSPRKIRRISPWKKSETGIENTNLKGRMRFIARNVSNNTTRESKPGMSLLPRMMTISENKGDVMVEKTSTRTSPVLTLCPGRMSRILTCRDRRALSLERSRLGSNDRGSRAVCHQLDSANKLTQNHLPIASTGENRSVSKVSEHAFKRIGAQPATLRRSI